MIQASTGSAPLSSADESRATDLLLMNNGRIFQGRFAGLLGLAALTGVMVWTLGVHAQNAGGGAGSKLALVDIEKVINALDEVKIGQTKIASNAESRQAELNNLTNQIKQGNEKLDLMPMNDVHRRDEAVKLMELNAVASAKMQAYQAIINIEKGDLFKDVHGRIMDACAKYAEKNGIELVMVDDRVLQFQENDALDKVSGLIAQKRILYGAPALDITDAILTAMNNDFQAAGGRLPERKPAKKP